MDISVESVGAVSRRERLLQEFDLYPRVTVTLEWSEAIELCSALQGADYQYCDANLSLLPAVTLQKELVRVIEAGPHAGEDS